MSGVLAYNSYGGSAWAELLPLPPPYILCFGGTI